MINSRYLSRYFLLGILALSISVSQPSVIRAEVGSKQTQQHQAEVLNQRGQRQLDQGQPAEALETWQQATKVYQQLKNAEGVTGTLINQSIALQTLGIYPRACTTLLKSLKLDILICDTSLQSYVASTEKTLKATIRQVKPTSVNLLALQNLGDVLYLMGKVNESKTVLQETLTLAQQNSSDQLSNIYLSLGNLEKEIYQQLRDKYAWIEEPLSREQIANILPENVQNSLKYYEFLEKTQNVPQSIKLQAQLNHLTLLISWGKWLKDEPSQVNTYTEVNQLFRALVNQIESNSSVFSQLSPDLSIQAMLNFANNLSEIPDEQLRLVAIRYTKQALEVAENINSTRWRSYSLGTLGQLETQPSQKQAYFKKALGLAQSIWAWDIAYQWQQELGLIYQKQGQTDLAIQNYDAAIANMTKVRDSLLSTNADLQYSFQEEMEPTYRNYMRLLLASPNPDLKRVIQINEGLQIARLENFLRCGKLDLVALNQLQNLNSAPTVIHIIDLGDTIETIVQSPDGSLHHHRVKSELVRSHVYHLLEILQSEELSSTNDDVIIASSLAIYENLIAPIKKYLTPSGTLVFTLDKTFQSLPMALLYDGKDYLIQKYSITGTLSSRIRQPKSLHESEMIALIAGISKPNPSLTDPNVPEGMGALPQSKQEVENVEKQTKSSLVLLDDKFTLERFKEELTQNNFPIVHITTHGQFSSDPSKTVLLAYDKVINIKDFENLLKDKTQNSQDAIELLVLSACETAKGNKQSAMGIAGIAAQAGARSTVATLWRVDANSTTVFMEEFYRGLNNGLTKAEALRQAQLKLMSNPLYKKPYYWAPFLLIGSWL